MQFAPLYPLLYRVLTPIFPGCLWAGNPATSQIALTFDDGPHPHHTPQLLDVLEHYHIQASFFWLGHSVQTFPNVARDVYEYGHWLGLHGYHHRSFPLLSAVELKAGLMKTQGAIAQACNLDLDYVRQYIRDVRPPNGLFTPQILNQLQQWGYRSVMWSVVPEDWVRPGVEAVVQRVLRQTQNGSLIVLHDGYCGGQDVCATLEQLIPALLDRGYQFVTVDQLWQHHSKASLCSKPLHRNMK